MADLDTLKNEFKPNRESASLYAKWKQDNKNAAAAYEQYEAQVIQGLNPPEPALVTKTSTGRMLLAAVKMGKNEVTGTPPVNTSKPVVI